MLEFSHLCTPALIVVSVNWSASDLDVGAGDQGVRLGYTSGGLEATGWTTILFELKLVETVTIIATFGSNVEIVEYSDFRGQPPPSGCERSDPRCRQSRSRQGWGGRS